MLPKVNYSSVSCFCLHLLFSFYCKLAEICFLYLLFGMVNVESRLNMCDALFGAELKRDAIPVSVRGACCYPVVQTEPGLGVCPSQALPT